MPQVQRKASRVYGVSTMLIYTVIALAAGYAADMVFGDPHWLYHPVRLIGKLISALEAVFLRGHGEAGASKRLQLAGGAALVIIVCAVCVAVPYALLRLCFMINTVFAVAVMSFMCYQMLAAKSLRDESMKVYDAVVGGTAEDARQAVSMIVGRDTECLDKEGVTKAAVETVAENFSDGVIAPLFYMALGGPVLMILYKGINTMDSLQRPLNASITSGISSTLKSKYSPALIVPRTLPLTIT